MLKDSQQMIPRTKKSLEEAVVQLEDLVVGIPYYPEQGKAKNRPH